VSHSDSLNLELLRCARLSTSDRVALVPCADSLARQSGFDLAARSRRRAAAAGPLVSAAAGDDRSDAIKTVDSAELCCRENGRSFTCGIDARFSRRLETSSRHCISGATSYGIRSLICDPGPVGDSKYGGTQPPTRAGDGGFQAYSLTRTRRLRPGAARLLESLFGNSVPLRFNGPVL